MGLPSACRWCLLPAISAWVPGSARAAEPCAPAASLGGDAEGISPVRRTLIARGVADSSRPGCPGLKVEIALAGAAFDLRITDPDGRTSERRLDSADAAATLIESWARTELSDPLLAVREPAAPLEPRAPTSALTAAAPPPDTTAAADMVVAARLPTRPARARSAAALVGISQETALSPDRSVWMGAAGGLCLRAGPLCAGASARFAQAVATPAAADGGAGSDPWTRLRAFEALATLEAPVAIGRVRLVPAVGVGVGRVEGWWRSRVVSTAPGFIGPPPRDGGRDDRDHRSPGRPDGGAPRSPRSEPRSPAPTATGETTHEALRATAGLALLVPIAGAFSIEVGLSGAASFAPLRVASEGHGGSPAALPTSQLRAGLGIRYGRP